MCPAPLSDPVVGLEPEDVRRTEEYRRRHCAAELARRLGASAPERRAILWVDDYPSNNSFVADLLRRAGFSVSCALTTTEAQAQLSSSRYAVVLSDMGRQQNETAGLDLLQWMRDRRMEAPVLVYASGRAVEKYGERAKQLGALECTSGVVSLLLGITAAVDLPARSA